MPEPPSTDSSVSGETPTAPLSAAERQRYDRQLTLPDVGLDGQLRLRNARVLIVGAGGLGSPTALYLAAAGVGTIGLVDGDAVDASNLHRQLLHGTRDVGRSKLDSARDRLHDVNPHVTVHTHNAWLTSANALDIVREYDIVIDGTDNFATRYLVNDACVLLGKPNVHGSVYQFDGQASVFALPDGPCYRCLFPEPPPPGSVPNCAEGGVLGALPGLVGTIQAIETLKLLLGVGDTLSGRLLMIDARTMHFRTVHLDRDPACPVCGTRTITELLDYDAFCGTPPLGASVRNISPAELRERLQQQPSHGPELIVIDVREPHETAAGVIAGATLIPLSTLAEQTRGLDRNHDIVLVCRSGVRSEAGAQQLMAAGYTRIASVTGGMLAWDAAEVAADAAGAAGAAGAAKKAAVTTEATEAEA